MGVKLKIGDIVYVHAKRNWVSKLINICQTDKIKHKKKIPYHVGVITTPVDPLEHSVVTQSTWGNGVETVPLSQHMYKAGVTVWVKRYKLTKTQQKKMEKWLSQQIGKKYDKLQLLPILTRSFLRLIPPAYWLLKKTRNPLNNKQKFICSELVYLAFMEVGVNIYRRGTAGTVTPYDLDKNTKLKKVYTTDLTAFLKKLTYTP